MEPRRGFTLIELAAVVATIAVVGPLAILGHQPANEERQKRKDATQVRAIHQGFVVWAQNNADTFPLPSAIDKGDLTVADRGTLKDTTSNVYSVMVFNGTVSTEVFVSPVETNKNIAVFGDYAFDKPKKAASPEKALWDPAFSVDFTSGNKGAASYAHLQPSGERTKRWSNTFNSAELIVSMRGPEVASVQKEEDGGVRVKFASAKSNTIGMYEATSRWRGNQVTNDNHVEFVKGVGNGMKLAASAKGPSYAADDGKKWPDVWNYDEPDDAKSVNNFLGIFARAGAKPAEFKAIWD